MGPLQLASILYSTLRDDPVEVAAIRNELKSLAKSMATDASYGTQITSATVNGQSYAGAVTMSNLDRLVALRAFIRAVDNCSPPTSRTYARF